MGIISGYAAIVWEKGGVDRLGSQQWYGWDWHNFLWCMTQLKFWHSTGCCDMWLLDWSKWYSTVLFQLDAMGCDSMTKMVLCNPNWVTDMRKSTDNKKIAESRDICTIHHVLITWWHDYKPGINTPPWHHKDVAIRYSHMDMKRERYNKQKM